MHDATFSATSTIAYSLWAISAVLLTFDLFVYTPLGAISIFVATAACTVHVRSFICAMSHREREAYNLGRDSVRSLHPVDR